MVVFPNAKINIGLNIVAKRDDGFHNIESVFYPVLDLFDVLEVIKSENLTFKTTGITIPDDEKNNLCLKAYYLIEKDFKISPVHIHLHKVIPIGAGLGGGSADAAFMLTTINELFELQLSSKQLINYAQQLGSDCAFFIENKPVYAFNKGNEFETISLNLSNFELKIEYPEIHIGTAEAYSGVHPQKSTIDLKQAIKQPIDNWKTIIRNDFEKSIFKNHPKIEALKNKMYQNGAVYAAMTGSGSAVYGFFKK